MKIKRIIHLFLLDIECPDINDLRLREGARIFKQKKGSNADWGQGTRCFSWLGNYQPADGFVALRKRPNASSAVCERYAIVLKDRSNKAENGKGIEGALGPGGLRGRVFGAAHGETEGF